MTVSQLKCLLIEKILKVNEEDSLEVLLDFIEKLNKPKTETLEIIPIVYDNTDEHTHFEKLIKKEPNSLFIYNENEEDFKSGTYKAGGGNAILRPWRSDSSNGYKPKSDKHGYALGIPTGSNGEGYQKLDSSTKKIIKKSFSKIHQLLKENPTINKIYYSVDEDGKIGTNIFNVNGDVISYITKQLNKLSQ